MAGLKISIAESQVMEVVWEAVQDGGEGAGADEILAAAGPAHGWSESTVRTLIHRLIRKGALKSERRRGAVVYTPLVSRDDWVSEESRGLVDRLFGGRMAGLIDHVARGRDLSPDDVARLRRLVADLDADAEDED